MSSLAATSTVGKVPIERVDGFSFHQKEHFPALISIEDGVGQDSPSSPEFVGSLLTCFQPKEGVDGKAKALLLLMPIASPDDALQVQEGTLQRRGTFTDVMKTWKVLPYEDKWGSFRSIAGTFMVPAYLLSNIISIRSTMDKESIEHKKALKEASKVLTSVEARKPTDNVKEDSPRKARESREEGKLVKRGVPEFKRFLTHVDNTNTLMYLLSAVTLFYNALKNKAVEHKYDEIRKSKRDLADTPEDAWLMLDGTEEDHRNLCSDIEVTFRKSESEALEGLSLRGIGLRKDEHEENSEQLEKRHGPYRPLALGRLFALASLSGLAGAAASAYNSKKLHQQAELQDAKDAALIDSKLAVELELDAKGLLSQNNSSFGKRGLTEVVNTKAKFPKSLALAAAAFSFLTGFLGHTLYKASRSSDSADDLDLVQKRLDEMSHTHILQPMSPPLTIRKHRRSIWKRASIEYDVNDHDPCGTDQFSFIFRPSSPSIVPSIERDMFEGGDRLIDLSSLVDIYEMLHEVCMSDAPPLQTLEHPPLEGPCYVNLHERRKGEVGDISTAPFYITARRRLRQSEHFHTVKRSPVLSSLSKAVGVPKVTPTLNNVAAKAQQSHQQMKRFPKDLGIQTKALMGDIWYEVKSGARAVRGMGTAIGNFFAKHGNMMWSATMVPQVLSMLNPPKAAPVQSGIMKRGVLEEIKETEFHKRAGIGGIATLLKAASKLKMLGGKGATAVFKPAAAVGGKVHGGVKAMGGPTMQGVATATMAAGSSVGLVEAAKAAKANSQSASAAVVKKRGLDNDTSDLRTERCTSVVYSGSPHFEGDGLPLIVAVYSWICGLSPGNVLLDLNSGKDDVSSGPELGSTFSKRSPTPFFPPTSFPISVATPPVPPPPIPLSLPPLSGHPGQHSTVAGSPILESRTKSDTSKPALLQKADSEQNKEKAKEGNQRESQMPALHHEKAPEKAEGQLQITGSPNGFTFTAPARKRSIPNVQRKGSKPVQVQERKSGKEKKTEHPASKTLGTFPGKDDVGSKLVIRSEVEPKGAEIEYVRKPNGEVHLTSNIKFNEQAQVDRVEPSKIVKRQFTNQEKGKGGIRIEQHRNGTKMDTTITISSDSPPGKRLVFRPDR